MTAQGIHSYLFDTAMIVKSTSMFFYLYLCKENHLIKRLRKSLEFDRFRFYPEASGRVALYKLASILYRKNKRNIALIPDYICNVVPYALEKAGYEVQSYQTGHLFEPSFTEIKETLSEGQISLFLTANVFGSTAFLDGLKSIEIMDIIFQKDVHVVVDLCQDISLIKYLPSNYGSNLSSILSFNDKSFLGVMGGGILTQIDLPESARKVTPMQSLQLHRVLLSKMATCLMNKLKRYPKLKTIPRHIGRGITRQDKNGEMNLATKYDYSFCRRYPYTLDILAVSKIQLIMAIIGLSNLHLINAKKRRFATECQDILKTEYCHTSPYLAITTLAYENLHRKMKPSYALHHFPDLSLRSELAIIHNKGFCDEG
jgi:hypothetical protein